MKVAVYLRLSKDSPESTSISRQQESCQAAALSRWPDAQIDVYQDVDISGYRDVVRPDFDRLLANIHHYRGLVVYRVDRLTRRGARHLLELVEDRLRPAGCALVSATEPIDTDGPFGELFLMLLATFSKMESERLGERKTAANAHLRSAGRWAVGSPPYGYKTAPAPGGGKVLVIDELAAARVLQAARDLLAGTPPAHLGPPHTRQGWRLLLSNPTLAGYMTYKRRIVFDDAGQPLQPWDAILDPALFRQVQEILARTSGRAAARRTLLGGLALCGRCQGQQLMYGGHTRGVYRCEEGHNAIHMGATDQYVLGRVSTLIPEIRERARRAAPRTDRGQERARKEAKRDRLQERLKGLYAEHDITHPSVRIAEEALDEVVADLAAFDEPAPSPVLALVTDGTEIRDLPLHSQRRAVEQTVTVTISPASGRGGRFDVGRIQVVEQGADGGARLV